MPKSKGRKTKVKDIQARNKRYNIFKELKNVEIAKRKQMIANQKALIKKQYEEQYGEEE
jgi:hypothetical protein